jgi:small subunit ribosomal protein S20
MPNTKSAERRVRSNKRKYLRNQSIKSRIKTLERNYRGLTEKGEQEATSKALSDVVSALDKAAKKGVIHKRKADRKKSRLTRLKPALAA